MKHIVVLDAATMRGELLRPSFAHRWSAYPLSDKTDVAARIEDAHYVITNKTPVHAEHIAAAGQLELVAIAATGTDCVDINACRAAGVAVCNIRRYADDSVAEHVMAFIYALARGIVHHHQRVCDGEWSRSPIFSPDFGKLRDVRGMQIGIIGAGALGRATAARAEAAGMRAVFCLREQKDDLPRVPLPELLAASDVISLHCPLTAKSHHLINRDTLALMKHGAFLINTARGGLVDSAALVESLHSGHLGGAGIDVLPEEPPPPDDILCNCRHPGMLITPHVAWASGGALELFHRKLLENLESFHAGTPQNLLP